MDANVEPVGVITDRLQVISCSNCGEDIDVSPFEPFVEVECPHCDAVQPVPARLGPYVLLRLLGTGGMGGVYVAKDESLGRYVAIKVMLSSLGEDRDSFETFKREAQAAAQLNHPNIAQIYSFGEAKGQPYIVMELVSGKRFDKMVSEGKPLDAGLVLKVGIDMAEALKTASEIGLTHGDVKPENILFDEKMLAKLVDFGLASFVNQAAAGGIWGTPYYIAPEKVRRQKTDERADIYSLGATLYHAFAGQPPFDGETPLEVVKARLEKSPQPLGEVVPGIDERIEAIVARMLEPEPARRYPTYASLLGDLRKVFEAIAPSGTVGKRKKMIIKKKGSIITPRKNEGTGGSEGGSRGSKIVIRKAAGSVPVPRVTDKGDTGDDNETRQKKRGRGKKVLKGCLVTLLILVILGGIGAGVAFLKIRSVFRMAIKREMLAMEDAKKKADALYPQVQGALSNILAKASQRETMSAAATNAVFVVLGERLEIAPLPELPAEEPPAAAAAPEEKATSGPAETPVPPPAARAPAAAEPEGPPPGVMSSGDLGMSAPAAPAAEPVAVEPEPEPMPEPEPESEPEIKLLARSVLEALQTVAEEEREARGIGDSAAAAYDMTRTAPVSLIVEENIKQLEDHLESLKDIDVDVTAAIGRAKAALRKAVDLKTEFEEKRIADEEARLEEMRRQAEEEKRRREEEEHRQIVESERQMAEILRQTNIPLVKEHNYAKALRAAKRTTSAYKSDEGKEALAILVERYERLLALQAFLIEQLNAQPYPWGYGHGGGARDVLGADKRNLHLRDSKVPWTSVDASQMLKLVDHCIGRRSVRTRERCEQSLNAAIFCYEVAGPQGLDRSRAYIEGVAGRCSDIRPKAARLLPLE
ncbi:MAG: serine/threonine protein kinase [Lentisphaerae bacterium]|nr:serine/threonine protein kinase [Lentisphaerota bacterium]